MLVYLICIESSLRACHPTHPLRRSGMSNINVRALATMGIQKNYLRNIIKASYAMKVTSWSVGFSFEDMLIF